MSDRYYGPPPGDGGDPRDDREQPYQPYESPQTAEPYRPQPPPRKTGQVGGRPPRRTGVVVGRIALSLASIATLIAMGTTWALYKDVTTGLHTSDALSNVKQAPPHLDNAVNLLLIGLDSRNDMNGNPLPTQFVEQELHAGSSSIGGYNTNTLILMHIPANGGTVTAFSIPRDDYVRVDYDGVHGMYKIKEAYDREKAYAENQATAKGVKGQVQLETIGREAGRAATIQTVSTLTGVHIDHFAELNLLGFYDVAKAVGPINVCLNQSTSDPVVSRTDGDPNSGGGSGFVGHAGINTLDASMALAFVRQRHHLPQGDIDRTHRQQAFISAVTLKLKQQGIFGDLGKMQSLFNVVKHDVVIDDKWDILDFAQEATNLTGGNTQFTTLPLAPVANPQPVLPDAGSVNLVDPAEIKQLVTTAFGESDASGTSKPSVSPTGSPSPSGPVAPAVVDVFNASGQPGLAGNEIAALAAKGYTRGRTGNAATQNSTKVFYGSGADKAGAQIAALLGVTAVPSNTVSAGHVAVFLGTDFTPPPGSGSAATGGSSGSGTSSPTNQPTSKPTSGVQTSTKKIDGIPCVN